MSQVPLHDYLERMRARLREGQYADVLALGQHVLRSYPKHIETYRLLAEARLEMNDPTGAVDLFQRVRSADPENIVALVGLSIVHEQSQELEEAIWHLERAFEIQPANGELRRELLRLYAQYEGTPRERLKLTPGGLARLYARQGLYSQAIQEFRGLLQRDPTRADIQTALAETLYRVGRKQEAAEVAQELLEKMPYCLKANLLLGSLWSENGVPEAEVLLKRAQSLDPEYTVARELIADHWGDAPPPMLPAMGEEATSPASMPIPPVPTYEESAGREMSLLESLAPQLAPVPEAEVPAAPPQATEPKPQAAPPAAESLAPSVPEAEPSPVGPAAVPAQPTSLIRQEPEPAQPPVEPIEQQPIAAPAVQATETSSAPIPEPAESPSRSGVADGLAPVRRIKPSIPRIGPTIPGALDKLPAWLLGTAAPTAAGTRPAPSGRPAVSAGIAPVRSSPVRLPRAEKSGPAPAASAPQTREEPTDLPEWLTRARQAARSGEAEENIADGEALEEKPAWLTEENAESSPIQVASTTPEWLRAESTGTPPKQTDAEPEGPLPDWLSESEPEGEGAAPAASVLQPGWLSSPSQEAKPAAAKPETPIPEWLRPSESEAPPETPTASAAPAVEPEETLPEWLRELTAAVEEEPDSSGTMQAQPGQPASAAATAAVPESAVDIPEETEPVETAHVEAPAAEMIETAPTQPPGTEAPIAEMTETAPAPPPGTDAPAAATEPAVEVPVVKAETVEPVGTEASEPQPSAPVAEAAAPAQAEAERPRMGEKTETVPEPLLAQAHAAWTSGNRAEAIELYEKVLQKGPRFTTEVIADFEQFVQEPDAPLPAHRLLGDAYSMVGRFKEALEQYRIVLGR
jgi:tetratricopeptide (TPR) repeat protein